MVVDETILYTQDLDYHLKYEPETHPIICQLGGNNPETIRPAVRVILEKYDYDEININMGCPTNRVAGLRQFGAVLMKQVEIAESVVQAMKEVAPQGKPISVKCRVGVDEHDSLEYLVEFLKRLSKHCKIFYLHARKCVLGGLLTPAQNRGVPPLNYPRVYELCRLFPDCDFYMNGGIPDLKTAKELCCGRPPLPINTNGSTTTEQEQHQHQVPCSICSFPNGSCVAPPLQAPPNLKGCMLGRVARDNPCLLWDVDRYWYGMDQNPCQNRRHVLQRYCEYLSKVYPRRCCDTDPRITTKMDCLEGLKPHYVACPVCAEFSNTVDPEQIAPPDYCGDEPKITTCVMYRSVRPIWGIFFGLPKAKAFRRECDNLIRQDLTSRNCGPAMLIQKALQVVPQEWLDQDFVPTEEMERTCIKNLIHNSCKDSCNPKGRG
jgi:tRNA-dihydrouridine synthase A